MMIRLFLNKLKVFKLFANRKYLIYSSESMVN